MKIKKIYCFSYYDMREPSVRYRAKYVLDELKVTRNIPYEIVYPGYSVKNIMHFFFVFFTALLSKPDDRLIIYQNTYTRRWYTLFLKTLLLLRPENTLYDIDDADYLRFPPQVIYHFMKRCSACSVGSVALQQYAEKYNKHVLLLTSPVIEHSEIKSKRNDTLTIGWIGFYNAHKDSMEKLFLPALDNTSVNIRLVLLGVTNPAHKKELLARFAHKPNISLDIPEDIDWQDELSVYHRIKQFDIGISPLLPTEMNIAKSAFKLKQYMSCGVPVLGSDTGENKRFLVEGENGFFCNSPADYTKYIFEIYATTDQQYELMSQNARASVAQFSMEQYCSSLISYIEQKTAKSYSRSRIVEPM